MHILPLSATEIENRLKKLPEHVADQTYDANSEHPQSGKAVAEALSDLYTHYVGTLIGADNHTGADYLEPIFKINDLYIHETERCLYRCVQSEPLNDGSGAYHSVWQVVSPDVDKEYSATSKNAQSGMAVAQAVAQAMSGKVNEADLHSIAKTGSTDDLTQGIQTLLFDGGCADDLLNPAPGLYAAGSAYTDLITSWEDLLASNVIKVQDGALSTGFVSVDKPNTSSDALTGALMLPTDSSITTLTEAAFRKCAKLQAVKLPDDVTATGIRAFMNCDDLVDVDLPNNLNTLSTYSFAYCSKLSKIDLPDTLERIVNFVFKGCTSLTSITIPANVTEIGTNVFDGCTSLTTICYKGTTAQWANIKKSLVWYTGELGRVPATEIICSDGVVATASADLETELS